MDNYVKADEEEEFVPEINIDESETDVTVMHVKPGSKTKNLIQYAEKKLSSESLSQIIWEGRGDAVHKTITCAEIMKKKFGHTLHQITRLASMTIVETWKPRIDGLDAIRVKRHLPVVKILLSKEPLSALVNGYQAPEDKHGLFEREPPGSRPKNGKSQQRQNRNKRRNKTTGDEDAPDETLLADSIRRKEYDKKIKMEKKKKKAVAAAAAAGNQNKGDNAKRKQDSVDPGTTPCEPIEPETTRAKSVTNSSSGEGASASTPSDDPQTTSSSTVGTLETDATAPSMDPLSKGALNAGNGCQLSANEDAMVVGD